MRRPSELAESPTHASRIPVFAPTRRPILVQSWRVESSWGWATVTGKLGQQHRDVLDAAAMVAERSEWTTDGRLHLLVDPAKLRSVLGGDATNYDRIRGWLRDLAQAFVEMHIQARDERIIGSLVSDVVDSPVGVPDTRPGAKATGRRYWRVSFGIGWSRLIERDLSTRYPLPEVARLRFGISQAVARYCYTHRTVNEAIPGLAQRLGATRALRKLRQELQADSHDLARLGVPFDGERVTWNG